MKISAETIDVLKNFSSINTGLLFKTGSNQRTLSVAKNVFGSISVAEDFPRDFGIYDLPMLLATLSAFEEPDLEFTDTHLVISDNGKGAVVYYYSDPATIVSPPDSEISLPSEDVTFTLTQKDFQKISRLASIMNLEDIFVTRKGTDLVIGATDKSSETANTYDIVVGETDSDAEFMLHFKSENMKLLPDDYEVTISSALISRFIGQNVGAEYFIGLEKSSTYEE